MNVPKTPPPPPAVAPPARTQTTTIDPGAAATWNNEPPVWREPRMVLVALEGWGKTSFAAYAKPPVGLLMAGGSEYTADWRPDSAALAAEDGYETLLATGQVPQVQRALISSWPQLLATLDQLGREETPALGTLALDALGGFGALCEHHVCQRDFKGLWTEKGFYSFQKGPDVSGNREWPLLHPLLDRINRRGTVILLLAHCHDSTFRNPDGDDFSRWEPLMPPKMYSHTKRWADAVLFGKWMSVIDDSSVRNKGIGGQDRILCCTHRDAHDGKNRYGLLPVMRIPEDPKAVFHTVYNAMRKGT